METTSTTTTNTGVAGHPAVPPPTTRTPSSNLAVPNQIPHGVLDRSGSRIAGFWGFPSTGVPNGVQAIVVAGVESYKNALGGRTELSVSSYYTIEEKAKKIIEMRRKLQNMIENSDNEQLIVNLTMLHSTLDEAIEAHEDMLQR